MSKSKAAPSSKDIDISTFRQVLSLYPGVLETFYKDKLKGGEEKQKQAIDDEGWRYKHFPAELVKRKSGHGISKDELERLVRWKITHQTNRPFLLPQIRKNEAKTVQTCTAGAADILGSRTVSLESKRSSGPSRDIINKALDKACDLTGVGPATGTLILSIYDGNNVPFFEDELFAWLVPDHGAKLKYNTKEYFLMLDSFGVVRKRLFKDDDEDIQIAQAFEKVAFVCQHWDCVSEPDQSLESQVLQNDSMNKPQKDHLPDDAQIAEKAAETTRLKSAGANASKRKSAPAEQTPDTRRKSKRTRS